MAPEISTIVFKVYTPIKRKFKPLKDKNPTPEPLNAYNNRGIHSENDSEWPPLSSPSSIKSPVTQIWPKSPSLSITNEYHEISNEEKYMLPRQTDA